MKKTGWMFFLRSGGPMYVLGTHCLYLQKMDADKYLPPEDRRYCGITLEKVSVEITVLPPRRAK